MFYHIIANLFFLHPFKKKNHHCLGIMIHHFNWFLLVFDTVGHSLL